MNSEIKESALRTIRLEAESVLALQSFINDDFEKAVEIIHSSKGRVVITGVGKSAIIGQKIVATLNSTGTPSVFMHAADAVHGDMGMIQSEDVVIMISKSGESPEIKTLVPFIKNFQNPLIAITGNIYSFLALSANFILNTTINQEACPNNLSPTSSTTVQLVMGDALAVALMKLNEFTGNDFARFHPGGNLGRRLYLRMEDLYKQNMQPKVIGSTPLKEVILEISKGRLGATAVADNENKVTGIITDGDIRRLLEKTDMLSNIVAQDIVTKDAKTIFYNVLATEALQVMQEFDISQLIVINENKEYLGMVHLHDLIREGIS